VSLAMRPRRKGGIRPTCGGNKRQTVQIARLSAHFRLQMQRTGLFLRATHVA
jgi:hypothetical protein